MLASILFAASLATAPFWFPKPVNVTPPPPECIAQVTDSNHVVTCLRTRDSLGNIVDHPSAIPAQRMSKQDGKSCHLGMIDAQNGTFLCGMKRQGKLKTEVKDGDVIEVH